MNKLVEKKMNTQTNLFALITGGKAMKNQVNLSNLDKSQSSSAAGS